MSLWDACADGDGRACDRLYYDAGFDTRYEQFGNTCGDGRRMDRGVKAV